MNALSAETKAVSFKCTDRHDFDYKDVERTVAYPVVEAFYNTDSKEIEIELYKIGTATIYLISPSGVVMDEMTIDTDTPATTILSAAFSNGDFYVIIDSYYLYAEGYVMI